MKLYAVCDGPPSYACRMTLKALNIPYELVPVDYNCGEHLTDAYFKVTLDTFSDKLCSECTFFILFHS